MPQAFSVFTCPPQKPTTFFLCDAFLYQRCGARGACKCVPTCAHAVPPSLGHTLARTHARSLAFSFILRLANTHNWRRLLGPHGRVWTGSVRLAAAPRAGVFTVIGTRRGLFGRLVRERAMRETDEKTHSIVGHSVGCSPMRARERGDAPRVFARAWTAHLESFPALVSLRKSNQSKNACAPRATRRARSLRRTKTGFWGFF
jgi:hypothetical protein